jgi:transcriptional regulator with AAA-type ATPase domain
MPLLTSAERQFATAVGRLTHCNPFLPERIEWERVALGDDFDPNLADWNARPGVDGDHANLVRLLERSSAILNRSRDRLAKRFDSLGDDLPLYQDLLLMVMYHRFRSGLDGLILQGRKKSGGIRAAELYRRWEAEAEHYLSFPDGRLPMAEQLPHLFAGFFQLRRAFENIFQFILGISRPAVQLRAAVWESIFTCDLRRYRRALYDRMSDFTTLITGPSGTGKELVAQAIGLSRYIAYDRNKGKFSDDFAGSFYAVNLAALSPTLIESELFGHRRGAFTGAIEDREGWLEVCPPQGTVFLDEIGEVDVSIQVKLLRVLQSRVFSRLGETTERPFRGKIIAATNRQLAHEMHAGRFRQDFYYRLCSDVVEVPSLRERVADSPLDLQHLVTHLAQRAIGAEGDALASEVLAWIDAKLGPDYPWPGNIRELEQCLRNVLVRRSYTPPATQTCRIGPHAELTTEILSGTLTADELLRRYCQIVFAATGSYEATAKKLKLDWRTVRARVEEGRAQ